MSVGYRTIAHNPSFTMARSPAVLPTFNHKIISYNNKKGERDRKREREMTYNMVNEVQGLNS